MSTPGLRHLRSRALALLAGASLGACGGGTTTLPAKDVAPSTRAGREPTESLERLERTVVEVESADGPLTGLQLATAVRALAASLEPLSHAGRLRLEALASRMAGAPVRSLPQAGLLQEGLRLLLDSLVRVQPSPGAEQPYRDVLRRLAETRERLDELLLLDDQRPRLADALRAAANAVFFARGGQPPFVDRAPAPPDGVPARPFEEQLAQARHDIAEVARIPLTGSRLASARALATMADMIEAADGERRFTSKVEEVRFQATRLERGPETAFGRAGWIRAGLQAAVDVLSLASGGRRSAWLDEAQRAVAGIDAESPSSFQRAAVQDAFRATVDAFAALMAPTPTAPVPGD